MLTRVDVYNLAQAHVVPLGGWRGTRREARRPLPGARCVDLTQDSDKSYCFDIVKLRVRAIRGAFFRLGITCVPSCRACLQVLAANVDAAASNIFTPQARSWGATAYMYNNVRTGTSNVRRRTGSMDGT